MEAFIDNHVDFSYCTVNESGRDDVNNYDNESILVQNPRRTCQKYENEYYYMHVVYSRSSIYVTCTITDSLYSYTLGAP